MDLGFFDSVGRQIFKIIGDGDGGVLKQPAPSDWVGACTSPDHEAIPFRPLPQLPPAAIIRLANLQPSAIYSEARLPPTSLFCCKKREQKYFG